MAAAPSAGMASAVAAPPSLPPLSLPPPQLRVHHSALASHAAALRAASVVKFSGALLYAGPRAPLALGDLWVQNGRIIDPARRFWEAASAARFACDIEVDATGCIIAPGFIDLQFNGAYGVDFSLPNLAAADIARVMARLPSSGVTATCPTLVSSNAHTYRAVLKQVRACE